MCLLILYCLFLVTMVSPKTLVILHAGFRTGSSFLGELFNQNPSVFYVFEPLKGVLPKHHHTVLEDIVNTCSSKSWGIIERSDSFKNESAIFSRCLFTDILAVKTIRIRSLARIPLTYWSRDTKIIQLIRDPRATLHSRLQYPVLHAGGYSFNKDLEGVSKAASLICQQYQRDTDFQMLNISGMSLRVMFEDLVEHTYYMTHKIYHFLGMQVPEQVLTWIKTLETVPAVTKLSSWRSTHQDPDNVLKKWRTGLSSQQVCAIEKSCYQLLQRSGYSSACLELE